MKTPFLLAVPSVLLVACSDSSVETVDPADLILTNGSFYTVDAGNPWAEAVAISGGRYLYVGDAAGVNIYRGAETRIVDLQGAMAMPGFYETHAHAWQGGY